MLRHLAVTALLAASLAACGGGSEPAAPVEQQDAAQVADALKAAGVPVESVFTVTAENDPNKLLGRPNGYTSKVVITDSRVPAADRGEPDDVDSGAAVEVFANAAAAQARADYIDAIRKSSPILANEYDYVHGPVLLRVTGNLTPDQAKVYDEAMA